MTKTYLHRGGEMLRGEGSVLESNHGTILPRVAERRDALPSPRLAPSPVMEATP